ncbi:MAG TPA: hypothetical protein VHG52_14280, partial [Thermomicrobiales bacterium]|nr:hypothetical protein [Thermomicrobiales bacterium]
MWTARIQNRAIRLALPVILLIALAVAVGVMALNSADARDAAPAASINVVEGGGDVVEPGGTGHQAQVECGAADYLGSDGQECPPAWLGPDYIAMTAVGCVLSVVDAP